MTFCGNVEQPVDNTPIWAKQTTPTNIIGVCTHKVNTHTHTVGCVNRQSLVKSTAAAILRWVLRGLFSALFTLGFVWLCWGQIDKFFAGKTSVTTEFRTVSNYSLPLFVLCNRRPFRAGAKSMQMSKGESR